MSNTEDCHEDEAFSTIMKSTKLLNYNNLDASANTDEEMVMSSNMIYNMLNGQVRRLCETVQDSQVHSKMVMNVVGEWINKIRRIEMFNVEFSSLNSLTAEVSVLRKPYSYTRSCIPFSV